MADMVERSGWVEAAEQIRWCGRTFHRHGCKDCSHTWNTRDTCHHRLCPYCSVSRSSILFDEHSRLARVAGGKHLVLTLKNIPGLGPQRWPNGKVMDAVDWIRSCFTRLRNRKFFKRAWRGGIYSIEFTWSIDEGWHVHIHAFLNGQFVPQSVISEVWERITGNSKVVWIKAKGSMKEVLKYILKPINFTASGLRMVVGDEEIALALDDFLTVTEGKHLVSTWGEAWDLKAGAIEQGRGLSYADGGTRACPMCAGYQIVTSGPFIESLPPRSPPAASLMNIWTGKYESNEGRKPCKSN